MKRSYLVCQYCQKEIALQGIDMHMKVQHPEKHAEFRKNYEKLKKTAVVRDIKTEPKHQQPASQPAAPKPLKKTHLPRKPVKRSTLPAAAPPVAAAPAAAEPVSSPAPGGEVSPSGQGELQKSFLEEVSDVLLDWINTP